MGAPAAHLSEKEGWPDEGNSDMGSLEFGPRRCEDEEILETRSVGFVERCSVERQLWMVTNSGTRTSWDGFTP